MVGRKIFDRDQREHQPKGYTSHEVTAARAGRQRCSASRIVQYLRVINQHWLSGAALSAVDYPHALLVLPPSYDPTRQSLPEMNKSDQIDTVLASLWKKNLPTLRERLDLLDRTASLAASGTLPEAPRLEAYSIAHKLTGSLDMFGYQQGTDIARKIEHILKAPTPKQLTTLTTLAKDLRSSLAAGL